ncbi:hypothetical protein E4U53_007772 [Claviceps sorghi]|nr:hypothetical protein E4U53_007772 [Claviceps sorghi]
MKIFAAIVLAISGLALAVEQNNPVARDIDLPSKDNRNLRYANDLPVAMAAEQSACDIQQERRKKPESPVKTTQKHETMVQIIKEIPIKTFVGRKRSPQHNNMTAQSYQTAT